jgi:hypothetical protein
MGYLAIIDKTTKQVINTIVCEKEKQNIFKQLFSTFDVIEYTKTKESKEAKIGYFYDEVKDGYKPFKSCEINATGEIVYKKTYPTDGGNYTWNEEKQNWDKISIDDIKQKEDKIK